jgi:hypothetical protein
LKTNHRNLTIFTIFFSLWAIENLQTCFIFNFQISLLEKIPPPIPPTEKKHSYQVVGDSLIFEKIP